MKLLFESWRKFINEEMEEPITTLRIFDFDETIAHTRSETRIIEPDGTELTLSDQKQFDEYMRAKALELGIQAFDPIGALIEQGYKIDLSDFSIVKDPEEITVVTDIMREFPPDSKTYIMTARRGQSLGPILDYLEEIGIDPGEVRPMATQGDSKGNTIANMIGQKRMSDGKSNIRRVEYYEDSQKNIEDVLENICNNEELNKIKPVDFELVIYKVDRIDDGYNLSLISCP